MRPRRGNLVGESELCGHLFLAGLGCGLGDLARCFDQLPAAAIDQDVATLVSLVRLGLVAIRDGLLNLRNPF